MTGNPDQLRRSWWETYYDSYYFEILTGKLISRWKIFDLVTKILIALTATGSTVAGWSLWDNPTFKVYWVVIAGLTSILSIVHAVVQVQSILEKLTGFRIKLCELRVSLETFDQSVSIYSEINIGQKFEELKYYREKLKEYESHYPYDLLATIKLRTDTQDQLNIKLGVEA